MAHRRSHEVACERCGKTFTVAFGVVDRFCDDCHQVIERRQARR
jgi:protein-arginine kinase activator protein McsA